MISPNLLEKNQKFGLKAKNIQGGFVKVLHLPTPTGGNSWGLSRAERELGLKSDVLIEESFYFDYPADINLNLHLKNRLSSTALKKIYRYYRKFKAFLDVRNKYNIFHFNAGKTLLHSPIHPFFYQFELPFYPKKSKLFVTYNGSEARQRYPSLERANLPTSEVEDKRKSRSIEKMAKHVDWMWSVNPDLLYYLPKEISSFLPYSIANFNISPAFSKSDGVLKIVHAPTNQLVKGTAFILEAIEKLKKKYPNHFKFELIQGLSHHQALEKYREADLVIDQILLGWYGAFAVEVMLMGKPVIVNIAEEDLKFIPKEMAKNLMETIIQAGPSDIYEVLEKCIHDRASLKEKSEASVEYAREWHNPRYIANITKEKYESTGL